MDVAHVIRVDFNNDPSSITGGNDNDNIADRTADRFEIPAGVWTKVAWGSTNTNSNNINKLDLSINDGIGIINATDTATTVWKIRNPKIELGNRATDYTPAPEDIQSQIDESKQRLDDIADNILTQREIYSTQEAVIGTWIDGKPLYQKTVDFGTLPNADSKTVNHGIADVDLIWINQSASFAFQASTGQTWSLIVPTMGQTNTNVDRTAISIKTGSDGTNYTATITLNYTKTTD